MRNLNLKKGGSPACLKAIFCIYLSTAAIAGCAFSTPIQMKNPLISIPAGWFIMGEDDGRFSNQPRHQVYLDEYEIQRTEITRQAFAEFLSATGYHVIGWDGSDLDETADLPVTGIIWKDAAAYCDWVKLRLPTEAEWEKAARGDDGRRFPWGNEWDTSKANTLEGKRGALAPVGSYPKGASPYGLLDMSGNAAEWVADYFDFTDYTGAPDHNPSGTQRAWDHGLRGGSYASPVEQVTTYFRDSSHSAEPNPRLGFRCAR